ncbi:hypothetical protein [Emticicia fluvialis]|uniref:hypothetical protein n=1 Tax=Emticicia fluvialis TaxID=2974474 RepID=UPI002165BF8E|nr:hypothetical protein [Emticicia fluvialis]
MEETLTSLEIDIGNGFEDSVSWDELVLKEKVYPELDGKIKELIEKRLGYLPRPAVTIAQEPDLRILYNQYRFGSLGQADFYEQADRLIKHIRNKDVSPEQRLFDAPEIYKLYCKNYMTYVHRAHERINQFLGYEPPLEYSMAAVIWLTHQLSKENVNLSSKELLPIDYKVMTSIQYRELMLTYGEDMAIQAPLLAMNPI